MKLFTTIIFWIMDIFIKIWGVLAIIVAIGLIGYFFFSLFHDPNTFKKSLAIIAVLIFIFGGDVLYNWAKRRKDEL